MALDPLAKFGDIVEWNDRPERTADEVIDVLNRAANYWEYM